LPETVDIADAPVFSYVIASADMRYIEIEKRNIYLRNELDKGLVFRGEITGCGPGCNVGLNEILLEYGMSCEGCGERGVALKEVLRFGEKLGGILVRKTQQDFIDLTAEEKLSTVFKCILNSMNANYTEDCRGGLLAYSLTCCPLSECASKTGLGRSVELAHLSFVALCRSLIKALAPDWMLVKPSLEDSGLPIHKIIARRS
jgi:hypothetical protein